MFKILITVAAFLQKAELQGNFDCKASATGNPCDKNAWCFLESKTFVCICKRGYEGDGRLCVDRNECENPLRNGCSVNETCINTVGEYTCQDASVDYKTLGFVMTALLVAIVVLLYIILSARKKKARAKQIGLSMEKKETRASQSKASMKPDYNKIEYADSNSYEYYYATLPLNQLTKEEREKVEKENKTAKRH